MKAKFSANEQASCGLVVNLPLPEGVWLVCFFLSTLRESRQMFYRINVCRLVVWEVIVVGGKNKNLGGNTDDSWILPSCAICLK